MKVLINKDNVVIAKGTIEDLGEGNFKANGSIYGANLELTMIETDLDVLPQKDKIVDGVKVANETFQTYLDAQKQQAQDTLMLELIEGGLI